jgi:hypothetical protein
MVTAADLLSALRVASLREVEVAGLRVHVRGLTGAERKLIADRAKDGSPVQAHELAALCLCDEQGRAMFTADQAASLADVDGAAVEKVATSILEASGLVPEAQESAAKN